MAVSVGDVFELTIAGTMHGVQTRNVLHYMVSSYSGSPSPTYASFETAFLQSAMPTQIGTNMKAFCSAEWSLIWMKFQKFSPIPRSAGTISTAHNGPGGVSGSALPSSVTAVIRKRTEFAGKRYRGRMFVPGVPISYELDSTLNPAGVGALEALASDLTEGGAATVGAYTAAMLNVLVHKGVAIAPTPVISTNVDTVLRNQRRRQPGKGI